MSSKYILVTGSADEEQKILLFKNIFKIDTYSSLKKEYSMHNGWKIVHNCNLNRMGFNFEEFKIMCSTISNNLKGIICIENFNPRPETLLNDLKVLVNVFSNDTLKRYLLLFATFTNNNNNILSLTETRKDISDFRTIFEDYLLINDRFLLNKFLKENIWILNENHLNELNECKIVREYFQKPFTNVNQNKTSQLTGKVKKEDSQNNSVFNNKESDKIFSIEQTKSNYDLAKAEDKFKTNEYSDTVGLINNGQLPIGMTFVNGYVQLPIAYNNQNINLPDQLKQQGVKNAAVYKKQPLTNSYHYNYSSTQSEPSKHQTNITSNRNSKQQHINSQNKSPPWR